MIDERIWKSYQRSYKDRKYHHGRYEGVAEKRVDRGHNETDHEGKGQRKQIEHEQKSAIAESRAEFKEKVMCESLHWALPRVVISMNRSSSEGRSTRRSTSESSMVSM